MAVENEQQLKSQSNEQTFLFPLLTTREYNVRESQMCSQSQTQYLKYCELEDFIEKRIFSMMSLRGLLLLILMKRAGWCCSPIQKTFTEQSVGIWGEVEGGNQW